MNLEVITFTNIGITDFEGMYGGKITLLKAGVTVALPRFLAEHFCKHLTDKMLGENRGDQNERAKLKAKILGDKLEQVKETVKVEEQKTPEFEDITAVMPEPNVVIPPEGAVEEAQPGFKCEICGKVAKTKAGLGLHTFKSHSKK